MLHSRIVNKWILVTNATFNSKVCYSGLVTRASQLCWQAHKNKLSVFHEPISQRDIRPCGFLTLLKPPENVLWMYFPYTSQWNGYTNNITQWKKCKTKVLKKRFPFLGSRLKQCYFRPSVCIVLKKSWCIMFCHSNVEANKSLLESLACLCLLAKKAWFSFPSHFPANRFALLAARVWVESCAWRKPPRWDHRALSSISRLLAAAYVS